MKLNRINRWFEAFARQLLAWRWPVLALLLAFGVFALSGLPRVTAMVSEDSFFAPEDRINQQLDRFERLFGNNEQVAVLVTADDVFQPEVLRAIRDLGRELLARVPYADRVTSLTELDVAVGNEQGLAIINPLEAGIPETPEAIEQLRELILSRQALAGQVVTPDSRETWLVLSLHAFPDEREWVARGEENPLYQVGEVAIEVLTDPRWHSDAYRLLPIGMPYTETEERTVTRHEMAVRVGGAFVLMVLLLALFLRSWRGVVVPALTTIFGVAMVFGMMGWLGFAVDASMAMLPVFLGMALSVGYSVHIVNAIKGGLSRGLARHEAVVAGVAQTGWPILFTALTTVGSMLSFLSAGIILTSWLAWVTAAVVVSVYLYVSLSIPILFSFGRNRRAAAVAENPGQRPPLTTRWFVALGEWVLDTRKGLLIGGLVSVLLLLPALFMIKVNMDALEMMGRKVPYLQRIDNITRSGLGSYINYNIMLDFDQPGRIHDPDVLRRFQQLLDEVAGFELTKKTASGAKIQSLNDIVREMNQTLNADAPAYYRIPDDRELIAQLLLLYEIAGGKSMYQWIDDAHRSIRAQVELSGFAATEISNELAHIQRRAAELFPDGRVTLVGTAVKFAEMNKRLVTAELRSFLTALVVIAGFMVLVFGSVKTGLIGLIPNLAPVVAIGGLMGYAGFSLDMMTMTIMPMMLGIAVDDTIHFINHIKLAFEKTGCYRTAILESFATIAKNLAMTTIILACAFGVFITSPLNMITRIGMMTAIGLFAALIADYLLTPALIYLTKPFGPESATTLREKNA